ncbi:MAG: hypothetical protein KBT19_05040 [Lachnospiraceae bacterium]|nr:hypothetical protein [Candidatus Colinaster equi]
MKIVREYKNVILVSLLFVIGGAGHILLYGVDMADSICQIYYGVCVLVWALTVRERIIDKRVRNFFIGIAGLLLIAFLIQLARYKFIWDNVIALRYLWYSYYVVLEAIPLLTFLIAVSINLSEENRIDKRYLLVGIPCVVIIFLIYTNDFHNLVFVTAGETAGTTGSYGHGNMFYVCYAWIYILYALALGIITRKCAIYSAKRKIWVPLLFFITGFAFLVLSIFDAPKLFGISIWSFIEEYAFLAIGLTEACIQVGLLQANTGYKRLFGLSERMIKITDASGNTLYASQNGEKSFEESDDIRVLKKEISGGYVSWVADLTKLNELNRKINETTDRIETRNEFLKNDIAVKEERSKLDTRNKLYDNISHIVRPQLENIRKLIDAINDDNFDENIARIAVLDAYIKRRSNMELIETDDGKLPVEELYTAICESSGYISLCNFDVAVTPVKQFRLSKEVMTMAYAAFEAVVENNLNVAKRLLVSMNMKDGVFCIRFSMDKDALFDKVWIDNDEFHSLNGSVDTDCEDGLTVVVSFGEGGEA